jgi:hypothetical protein
MTTHDIFMTTLLEQIVELLDIPTSHYEKAAERYHSLGEWLHREQSIVAKFNPQVYPQGSFRYGTVNRPLFKSNEYDLDLVCEIVLRKSAVTQKQVKTLLGTEIISYAKATVLVTLWRKRIGVGGSTMRTTSNFTWIFFRQYRKTKTSLLCCSSWACRMN